VTPSLIPDRRLAPRPLPAHLASAAGLWLSSRIALPFLRNVLLPSSPAAERLRVLAAEIDAFGPEKVAGALDDEIERRAEAYLAGLEAYRRHPYRRPETSPPVLWQEGTTRLLDFGLDAGAVNRAVLVVPSLINRYYVLDLLPERSFLRHLAGCGLRPLVVDWGVPGVAERGFDLTRYIERLDRAFAAAVRSAGAPLAILGYCMGGLFALAAALRQRHQVGCLALLGTPWDFHAGQGAQARLLGFAADRLAPAGAVVDTLPIEAVQSFFFLLDPFLAERKFVRFASLDPAGGVARSFVALEDWINDGVPLGLWVAHECMRSWYGDNEPGRGVWRVAGRKVAPKLLGRPALVVIPGRDRIVPPGSAEPLAAALGSADVLRPALGHVGMMSATRAPAMLWTPIAKWLGAHLPQP
jgi:polyhydroxyalkanoate synthase